MNWPNCSGVVGTGSAISWAKRCCVSGAFSASVKAALSRPITSAGVLAGATRPHQVSTSKPLMVSAMAGTPGSRGEGRALVTASALILPALMLAAAAARLSML